MVTGHEKWSTYDNPMQKRSWSKSGETPQTVTKPGLTTRKVRLCIWWDWKGIIYYELLSYGQTLNSDLYCQQLYRLKIAIDQNWIFHILVLKCSWSFREGLKGKKYRKPRKIYGNIV